MAVVSGWSKDDSGAPNGYPPDDKLGGMEAKVGHSGWCLSGNAIPGQPKESLL